MKQVDVAVIGAGPAGSVAAHRLASAGATVALLDRSSFPRDKTCGDGVTADGLGVIERTGLIDWTKQFSEITQLRLTSPDSQILDVNIKPVEGFCNGRTIPRKLLDAQLVKAAVESGSELYENTRVRDVAQNSDGTLKVIADKEELTANMVILADGSHAPITRRLGLVKTNPEMVALRQYFSGDAGPSTRIELHFAASILPGYTWIFPFTNGYVNVGTGTYTRRVRKKQMILKDELTRFVQSAPHSPVAERLKHVEAVGPMQGHPLRTVLGETKTHAERILVVGDAAGMINPFTGEGIGPGMESAEMAAQHTLAALEKGDFSEHALSGYSQALMQRYLADRKAAKLLRLTLNSKFLFNRLVHNLKQNDELALFIVRIIIAQISPQQALRPAMMLRLLTGK